MFIIALSLGVAAGAAAADNNKPRRGRAHQVVPTGADDAAPAPDAAAEAELDAMTSRSTAGLTVVTRPGGGAMVDLEGRFMSVAVAGPAGATCHTGTAVRPAVKKARPSRKRAAKPAAPAPAPVPTHRGLEVM